jgi:4-hydroxy-tetrahydrodipicolinate reductase
MKIGIVGCAGRMGRMLGKVIGETVGADLAGGTEAPGSDFIGADLGEIAGGKRSGIAVTDDAAAMFAAVDLVIDFTIPAATVKHAALAAEAGTAMVIGTTGLSDAQMLDIRRAAERVAIVHAGNMSLGVNLLVGLAEQVAAALGPAFDIEVLEMHHKHKIDAPSGTALMLGKAAAQGRARPDCAIGYATLRGGDVVGEHTVIFAGPGERIEISHKAADRSIFAHGAVTAALWTEGKPAGLYSMRDVLGLS